MVQSKETRQGLLLREGGLLLLVVAMGGSASADEIRSEKFQAILDAAVEEGLMAVSAHVSWDDGSWTGVTGETSADSGETLNPDSLFRLASITKLFTAIVILRLDDENVLHLGDTLADRLPEGAAADVPHAESITIEMLLDHTSGIRSF